MKREETPHSMEDLLFELRSVCDLTAGFVATIRNGRKVNKTDRRWLVKDAARLRERLIKVGGKADAETCDVE